MDKSLLWIVRLTTVLYRMTSYNLVQTFLLICMRHVCAGRHRTERFSAAVFLSLNNGGWIVSDAGKWGSGFAPQSSRDSVYGTRRWVTSILPPKHAHHRKLGPCDKQLRQSRCSRKRNMLIYKNTNATRIVPLDVDTSLYFKSIQFWIDYIWLFFLKKNIQIHNIIA